MERSFEVEKPEIPVPIKNQPPLKKLSSSSKPKKMSKVSRSSSSTSNKKAAVYDKSPKVKKSPNPKLRQKPMRRNTSSNKFALPKMPKLPSFGPKSSNSQPSKNSQTVIPQNKVVITGVKLQNIGGSQSVSSHNFSSESEKEVILGNTGLLRIHFSKREAKIRGERTVIFSS